MALQFIGAPEDEAKKKKLERVQQQNASIIQEQKAPAISPVATTADWIGAPKPKVATKANPVVEITTKKPDPAYSPIDFTEIEQMDNNGLQDYIDRATVKTSQGNPLTEQEQLKVVKAGRLLAQKQAQPTANPYAGMIGEEQAQRDALQSQLAARRQTAVETQENALQQGYGEKKQRLYEEGKQQQQAAQSVLSFSGFGRSTYAADQQVKIEQNVQRAMAVLDAEREAAIEKYRLQQEGADADTLATYDNYIKQLQQKSAERIGENMKMVNEMNQENAASYQDKIKNILALSQQMKPAEPLTPEQQKIADSYATLAIDKDGNINEAFMKMIPSNLVSGVLQKAAELKASTPTAGDYSFSNMGQGLIAVQDPKTGRVTFQQGPQTSQYDFKSAGDQAYVFDPATGRTTPVNGTGGAAMRTDRHNNPTAMTTDVARSLGLVEGVDFTKGDPFPNNPNLYTARLLGDPIQTTIKALDNAAKDPNKSAFFTGSGQPRRTHTAVPDEQWNAMTPDQKAGVVMQMYQREGGSGELVGGGSMPSASVSPEAMAVINGSMSLKDVPAADRTRIAAEIQGSGQQIVKQSAVRMADDAIKRVEEILSSEGFGGAVGFGWEKGGLGKKPIPGTSAYDTYNMVESLKAIIAIPMLENMKGLGAMSEKEFETMKNAATTLDTNMTEKAFRKELQRIMDTMNAVKLRASSISKQTTQTPTSGPVVSDAPGGRGGGR